MRRLPALCLLLIVNLLTSCYQAPQHPGGAVTSEVNPARVGTPLDGPSPNGFALSRPLGSVLSAGQLIIRNVGDKTLTVKSIQPIVGDKGLTLLGVAIAGTSRPRALTQSVDVWPPDEAIFGRLQEATGAKIDAGTEESSYGYEVLIGFRVDRPGRSSMKGVRVIYDEDGSEKSVVFPSTLSVCTDVRADDCALEYVTE